MKPSDQLRQKIRDFREDKNLTQAMMAEKLGLSETGYAKIERGQSKLGIDRIQQIANVLEISIADLIPFGDDSVIACNHSDFSNSTNFSFVLGNTALEQEIISLRQQLETKNEVINSLKQQIETLNKLVNSLEK